MARKSVHIPLPILKARRDRLRRIVERRGGRSPRGKIPTPILERRLARLERIVEKRS